MTCLQGANGLQNIRQGFLADQQYLLGIQIKKLVGDDIAESHGALPINLRETVLQKTKAKSL